MSVPGILPITLEVGPLPENPLAAAAEFHAEVLPRVLAMADDLWLAGLDPTSHVTLVFAPADHLHRAWREAAIQTIARECAPIRINAVASVDEAALAAATAWLAGAPGVTGQFLTLDSHGAGAVLASES